MLLYSCATSPVSSLESQRLICPPKSSSAPWVREAGSQAPSSSVLDRYSTTVLHCQPTLCFCSQDKALPHIPDRHDGVCCVKQAGLKFTEIVLGIKVWPPYPTIISCFKLSYSRGKTTTTTTEHPKTLIFPGMTDGGQTGSVWLCLEVLSSRTSRRAFARFLNTVHKTPLLVPAWISCYFTRKMDPK